MTTIDTLIERNEDFATHHFTPLAIMPNLRALIVSCADPRVDPAYVLGLELGEALVLRNIGGRINPATIQAMGMLGAIAQTDGLRPGKGFNLIVFQHTDCGITRLVGKAEMLADYFGVSQTELDSKAVNDPRAAVAADIAALKANPAIPGEWTVSGLVYDVTTGRLETVVAPAPVRGKVSLA